MGEVEQSREVVEAHLSVLEERYDSFSINQTTLSVSQERYERERNAAREAEITVYTRVRNKQGDILRVDETDELPSTTTEDIDRLEDAAERAVTTTTSIDCSVQSLVEATILGIHNADKTDCETIYSLVVVFDALSNGGSEDETTWVESSDNWLSA